MDVRLQLLLHLIFMSSSINGRPVCVYNSSLDKITYQTHYDNAGYHIYEKT